MTETINKHLKGVVTAAERQSSVVTTNGIRFEATRRDLKAAHIGSRRQREAERHAMAARAQGPAQTGWNRRSAVEPRPGQYATAGSKPRLITSGYPARRRHTISQYCRHKLSTSYSVLTGATQEDTFGALQCPNQVAAAKRAQLTCALSHYKSFTNCRAAGAPRLCRNTCGLQPEGRRRERSRNEDAPLHERRHIAQRFPTSDP